MLSILRFSILLSHLTWHDSATLQWSQNIIYDDLTRLNTQKLSLSISKAYVPKGAWIFPNPAHLTNTCKHFHKARFPLRPRDFQDHLLLIHVDRLEQRISGLQSSCEGFNYLYLLPTLPQESPGLSFMSSFGCGFHFAFHFFFFFLTILSHKQGRKKQNKKKEDEKEGKTRVSVGRGTWTLWPIAEGVWETHFFCPAVIETQAVHHGHLPIQHLLLPP